MIYGENGSKSYENFLGVTENVFLQFEYAKTQSFRPLSFQGKSGKSYILLAWYKYTHPSSTNQVYNLCINDR